MPLQSGPGSTVWRLDCRTDGPSSEIQCWGWLGCKRDGDPRRREDETSAHLRGQCSLGAASCARARPSAKASGLSASPPCH
jgi:hypothetical protein